MNAHRQLGKSAARMRATGAPFLASLPPCTPASLSPYFRASLPPCVPASIPTQPRSPLHPPRITPFRYSRITRFLIDIWRLEIVVTPCRINKTYHSNRHVRGTFAFCTIASKLAKVLYSLADLVCYSRRRTRVPPPGLRALAPARPTWCESLPPPGHRELSVSSDSQYQLEASKLNGDFRARSYAN
jgi:hypothetical protein